MSQNNKGTNGLKQTKEISEAIYSSKVGQMLKMKSNARNGDLRKIIGAGTYQNA